MNDLIKNGEALLPIGKTIEQGVRDLIARKDNGTCETLRVKIGDRGSVSVMRDEEGEVHFFANNGYGTSCFMMRSTQEAKLFAEAASAFASAMEAAAPKEPA